MDCIKNIELVRDELLDMFTEATGEDIEGWTERIDDWAGTVEGKYLAMAYRLNEAIAEIQGM